MRLLLAFAVPVFIGSSLRQVCGMVDTMAAARQRAALLDAETTKIRRMPG